MRYRTWIRLLLMAVTALSIAAATRFAVATRAPEPLVEPLAIATSPAPAPRIANGDSIARAIAGRNPFRMSREPGAVRFNPEASPDAPQPPPSRPPRPALALAGVVLGAEPLALIDGLPGAEGSRVMRVGERAGDYVLRTITADRVVIAGPDTTWTLRVRSQYP